MPKVYANFDRMLDAKKALDALKDMGYKSAHLDALDTFNEEYSEEINPGTIHRGPNLSAVAQKSGSHKHHIGYGALIAANPMASGMGSYTEMAESSNTRLIVNVDDTKKDEVKSILRELGGRA